MDLTSDFFIETKALLDVIYHRFHQDFREYAESSLERRLKLALDHFQLKSISQLQDLLLRQPDKFGELLQLLTIPTTEMFRDPSYFKFLRQNVLPILRTYPSFKIWIAGCSTGEEIYSFAIMLHEEDLLDRSLIYATDINPQSLQKAEQGVFPIDVIKDYTRNYQAAGGLSSFSEYYQTGYGYAAFSPNLRKNVVFAEHSLATDSVFSEVELVSCRNVLIYFKKSLQERAFDLFTEALSPRGFLGLGSKESLQFSRVFPQFECLSTKEKIYRKVN